MNTEVVWSYKVDMYEEMCKQSRKEVTESDLE